MKPNIRLSNTLFSVLMSWAIIFIFVSGTSAQFETATVLGSARDSNEAAVQNATVTLRNVATDIAQTTTTDANGDYQFTGVKIGVYQVIVKAN